MKFVKAAVLVLTVLLVVYVAGHIYGYANKDTATTQMTGTSDELRARTHIEESRIRIYLYILLLVTTLASVAILGIRSLWKNIKANHRSFKSAMAQWVGPALGGPIHPRTGETVLLPEIIKNSHRD
ncbi:hypothetical protein HN935_02825 [archaeon]|jgi:hypothetical protein|nr:hypothetical protein [archaeon]